MDGFLVLSRLLLASVFVVAGLGKLADYTGSRRAMIDFGIPISLVTPFGSLMPLAELTIAGTLLSHTFAWWGAVAALALLLIFTIAIGLNLAQGRESNCHCFGKLYSTSASLQALIRNEMLAVVAGFVVWLGWNNIGPDVNTWLAALTAKQWIGLITGLIILALFTSKEGFQSGWDRQLFAGIRALQIRPVAPSSANARHLASFPAIPVAGLSVGSQAPIFDLPNLGSERVTLGTLCASGRPVMLIFLDPVCEPCDDLLSEMRYWQREYLSSLTIALISRETCCEDNLEKNSVQGLANILLQQENEVAQAYRVVGLPTAVIVQPDGSIGSRLALGAEAIGALVMRTVGTSVTIQIHPTSLGSL